MFAERKNTNMVDKGPEPKAPNFVFFLKISFFDNYESTVNYNLLITYVNLWCLYRCSVVNINRSRTLAE